MWVNRVQQIICFPFNLIQMDDYVELAISLIHHHLRSAVSSKSEFSTEFSNSDLSIYVNYFTIMFIKSSKSQNLGDIFHKREDNPEYQNTRHGNNVLVPFLNFGFFLVCNPLRVASVAQDKHQLSICQLWPQRVPL